MVENQYAWLFDKATEPEKKLLKMKELKDFSKIEVLSSELRELLNDHIAGSKTMNELLFTVLLKGEYDSFDQLLEISCLGVDTQNIEGDSLLHVAIKNRRFDSADKLVILGANLDSKNSEGKGVLELALEQSDGALVNEFINRGLSYNELKNYKLSDGETLLYKSIGISDQLVEHLSKSGDLIDETENFGFSALDLAICATKYEQLKILIKNGASVKAGAMKHKLHVAAKYNQPQIIELLIEKGLDPTELDVDELTAVEVAILHGSMASYEYLHKRRKLAIPENSKLFIAHFKHNKSSLDAIYTYTKNLDGRNEDGYTAVHMSIIKNNISALKWLYEKGANINIPCMNGITPLSLSLENNTSAITDYLISLKAEIRINPHDIEIIESLILNREAEKLKKVLSLITNKNKLLEKKEELFEFISELPEDHQLEYKNILRKFFDSIDGSGNNTPQKAILSFGSKR